MAMKPNRSTLAAILTFFAVFLVLLLSTCNEKESDCYECTTTFKIKTRVGAETETVTISDTREKCGQTEDQIREYENLNTDSATYYNGDVRIDTIVITRCTR